MAEFETKISIDGVSHKLICDCSGMINTTHPHNSTVLGKWISPLIDGRLILISQTREYLKRFLSADDHVIMSNGVHSGRVVVLGLFISSRSLCSLMERHHSNKWRVLSR